MKKIFLTLAIASITHCSFAQWSAGTGTIYPTATSDNVGIGTSSPQSILDIGKSQATPAFRIGNSNYGTNYNSIWGLKSGAESIMIFGNNGQNEIRAGNTNPGGYLDFFTNNTTDYTSASNGNFAMRLASNGYVGIGTTGPQHKLHVVNTGAVIGMVENTSSTADARVIAKNTLDQLQMGMDYSGGYFQLVGANSLRTFVNNAERMRVTSSGNVGIGTANPFGKLEVAGTVTAANYTHNKGISFTGTLVEPTAGYYSAGVNSVPVFGNGSGTMADAMGIYTGGYTKDASTTVTNSYGLFVDHNTMATTTSYGLFVNAPSGGATKNVAAYFGGNVGIGTTDPQGYKLAVNGNAIAESITVKLHGNWPDYVFKPKYNLLSLAEVKTYIDKNHRLPDMPSEAEVSKNGINLGEIVKIQTKKIEELTLYLIEQQKQIEDLKKLVIPNSKQ